MKSGARMSGHPGAALLGAPPPRLGKPQALSFFAFGEHAAQLEAGAGLFVEALEDFLESVI
jgi:hypothetical protein